jgi:hypothetical protein
MDTEKAFEEWWNSRERTEREKDLKVVIETAFICGSTFAIKHLTEQLKELRTQ